MFWSLSAAAEVSARSVERWVGDFQIAEEHGQRGSSSLVLGDQVLRMLCGSR